MYSNKTGIPHFIIDISSNSNNNSNIINKQYPLVLVFSGSKPISFLSKFTKNLFYEICY